MKKFQAAFLTVLCTALLAGPASAVIHDTTIYDIQRGMWALNDSVRVSNVVIIGVDIKPTSYGVYIQEQAGGAYSGILAFTNTVFPIYTPPSTTPAVGDIITVRGLYSEFGGLSEIINPFFTKVGTTTPLTPVTLPIDSLRAAYPGSERWEGVLIRVQNVQVTSLNAFNDWRIRHFSGANVFGDSIVGYEKMIAGQVIPEIGDRLTVVGVGDYAFNERRVAPRNDADITFLNGAPAAVPLIAWSSAENRIKVKFNVALLAADATNPARYSLSTFQPITAAAYDNANKLVTLTVGSNLTPSVTPHVLSMSGIRNYQMVPMNDPQTISFIGGISTIVFVQTPKSASNDSSQVANNQVSIRGVVTAAVAGASPDFPPGTGGFYMQQRGAPAYGGIFVFGPPLQPARGDSVFVSGVCTEFGVGPETEIVSVDEITVLGPNRPPIAPPVVTLANASGSNLTEAEKYEGMLIRINGNRTLTQGGVGEPFDISQALVGGTDTLRVDDLAIEESGYTPWRGDVVDVIGIIRFSGTAPFRRLQPRNWNEPPTGDIHVVSKANVSDVPPQAGWRTRLLQNEPNPFNPTTKIAFTLAREGEVALRVYTVDGRTVKTIYQGLARMGPNEQTWDGRDAGGRQMPTGVYLYRLVTDEGTQTRKMMLLK
jgi:hypothetical protein